MKRLALLGAALLLLTGCASYRGGTGNSSDTISDYGSSPDFNQEGVDDMNDLGWEQSPRNQKPNGQARVPGHSVDIQNEPQ